MKVRIEGYRPAAFVAALLLLLSALRVHVESPSGDVLLPHAGFVVLAVALLASTLLTAVVCVRVIVVLCLDEPAGRIERGRRRGALAVAVLVALAGLAIGLLPGPLMNLLERAVTGA